MPTMKAEKGRLETPRVQPRAEWKDTGYWRQFL
jgi:hypothetical protein